LNKKYLAYLSVFIGIVSYGILIVSTIRGNGEGLSLSTFALWSTLGWISAFTMIKHKANPSIPIMYATGSLTITIILLFKGKFQWSMMDTVVAILVIACISLWLTHGPKWALCMAVAAGVIAAIPFTIMTWKAPECSPIIPNVGAVIANFLSFLAAEKWSLEHRLYPGVNTIMVLLLVIPWLLM